MSNADNIDADYFRELKTTLHRHARSADSFLSAFKMLTRLRSGWETLDAECKAALFRIAVIDYSRPFSKSKGHPVYGTSHLKRQVNYDRSLHVHFLQMRNQLIAHNDTSILSGRFIVGTTKLSYPLDAEIPIRAIIRVTSLDAINDIHLIERLISHTSAAREASSLACKNCLSAFIQKAIDHPQEHKNSRKDGGEVLAVGQRYVTLNAVHDAIPSPPSSPKTPPLDHYRDKYNFRSSELFAHFVGSVVFVGKDGFEYEYQSMMAGNEPQGRVIGPRKRKST